MSRRGGVATGVRPLLSWRGDVEDHRVRGRGNPPQVKGAAGSGRDRLARHLQEPEGHHRPVVALRGGFERRARKGRAVTVPRQRQRQHQPTGGGSRLENGERPALGPGVITGERSNVKSPPSGWRARRRLAGSSPGSTRRARTPARVRPRRCTTTFCVKPFGSSFGGSTSLVDPCYPRASAFFARLRRRGVTRAAPPCRRRPPS
jgi:hypothetical protein